MHWVKYRIYLYRIINRIFKGCWTTLAEYASI